MATIDGVLMEIDSYTENANSTKELVLSQLVRDGIITQEQFNTYSEKWQVIIVKNSWFKKWVEKFSKEKNSYSIKYVKFEY